MTDLTIPSLAETRALPLTRIRRERRLAVRGEIVATVGSRVDPLDVVGRSAGAAHLRPVPIARYMQLTEGKLPKYMLKKPGEEVAAREIIASRPQLMGTLQRIYRAPGAGRIAALQGTWLTIELADAPVELKALYRGNVVDIVPGHSVTIDAMGMLVQGVWGAGGEGYGVLKNMVESPSDVLAEDKVDVGARGAILIAGAGVTEQTLRRAAQEHVAGLITGGLLPHLKDLAGSLQIPVLVTEGFGERPMAGPIYELLASHNGDETTLNTLTRARGPMVRPEVFIPTISTSGTLLDAPNMPELAVQPGATVRVLCAPYEGQVGKINSIPKLPQSMDSGISAWGAEIELTGDERVFVPWQNLELIG